MKDYGKTKAELIDDLVELRLEVIRLKGVEAECAKLKEQIAASVLVGKEPSQVIDLKPAVEATWERDEHYRDLYEEAPISYYSVGVDGRIRSVNKHMVTLLGYSRDELIGKQVLELYADTPEGKDKVKELFPLFQTGNQVHAELEMRRVDGKPIWIDLSVWPSFDEDGQVIESRAVALDITERKLVEKSVARRAAHLETVAKVSAAASTILERKKLLQEVVDLTKTSFDLYHAHIYLLNDTEDTLNLAAGAGDAGRQMVAEGWSIPLFREQSLVARAARTQQGVIVNDVHEAPDWLPNPLLPDTRSELAVPMVVRGRVVGVLDVQADKVNHFADEDIRIQTTLAAQVAVAIENARLFEQEHKVAIELETQTRHLSGLNELSRELHQATDENEIFKIAARRMPQIIRADRASVALLTEMGNDFDILALEGEAGVIPLGTQVPVEGTILGKAVRENYVIITSDIRDSDFPEHRQLAQQGLCSTMNVPLMAGGRVIGVLNVASKKLGAYDVRDQNLMLQAVSLLSSAIENLRLLHQTQERAEALAETTTFLDTILDNMPAAIAMKDAQELRYVAWNKANEEMTGFRLEDVLGKHAYDLFPKEIADELTTTDRELLAGNKLVEVEQAIEFADRGARHVNTTKLPVLGRDGKPQYLLGISIDITERKQAEVERERLLAELSRLSAVVEATSDFVAMTGLAGRVIYVNPAGMDMIGRSGENPTSLAIEDFRGFDETRRVMEEILPIVQKEGTWSGELGLRHVDGHHIPASSVVMLIRNEASEPIALGTIARDITELKQVEEALRASETKYRSLFARIVDPIFIFDAETNHFLDWNQAALDRYGYTPEELRTMTPYQLHPPEDLETVKRNIEDIEDTLPHQYTHVTKRGERFQVEISSTSLEYQGKEASMSIVRDITERKRAEADRERLLAEVEAAYRQYVRKEWGQFLNEQHQGRWLIEHQQRQLNATSETLAAIQDDVARQGTMKAVSGNGDNTHPAEATIVAPISLRGQVIGTLGLQDIDPDRQWTTEELGLVETVTEQLALTIENLRLFDDSQHRATREQLTRKITDRMRASPDADGIIRTGLTELANALGIPRAYVKLSPNLKQDESDR